MREFFKKRAKTFRKRKLYREFCVKSYRSTHLCEDKNRIKYSRKTKKIAFSQSF